MRYGVKATMDDGTQTGTFPSGTASGCDRIVEQIMSRQHDLGRRATCRVYADGRLVRVVTMKKWQEAR